MYQSLKVAAVIPALNEERLIGRTLESVPDVIDAIYVIDDGSHDKTTFLVKQKAKEDPRIKLLCHRRNRGVGRAIITGYHRAYKDGYDIFVVVGGDAQMDWDDLENLLKPIEMGVADYTKGNRFIYGDSPNTPGNAWREMPTLRILGNVTLSVLTKFASGYRELYDSQMGYTALHRRVFPLIDWDNTRHGYGYPAEWLMKFHPKGIRVRDVPVCAIYLKDERQSQIQVKKFVFYMLGILVKGWLTRIYREYLNGNSIKLTPPPPADATIEADN